MRLISFLGTEEYGETKYSFEGRTCRTRYVAHALATFVRPIEVHLIATTEAWKKHGAALSEVLAAAQFAPRKLIAPTGGAPEDLWRMFGCIIESIQSSKSPVMLDITHGFRMQPFFAAACIQFVQAVVPNPPTIQVVYGQYRKEEATSQVWELTPFLDVLSWSRSLMMFLQTGQADAVVEPTQVLARELSKQWASSGKQGTQPQLSKLCKALQDFSDDFMTIRTGALLIGRVASASRLTAAIDQTRHEVNQHLPALALVLDQVQEMIAPLVGDARLSSSPGQRTMLELARLYQKMGRYSEAISILREGWITLQATQDADHPGSPGFDRVGRKQQEEEWRNRLGKQADTVSEVRNDIQHAGFKEDPHNRKWFEAQLDKLMNAWQDAITASETTTAK